jgi:RimJ/RimL family protein N-acetyltransferase
MTPNSSAPLLLSRLAPLEAETDSGLRVRLRPIVPEDAARIDGAYALLSEESRRNRFWAAPASLAEERKAGLTDTDEREHLAWIALDPDDETFPGFAGASFWKDPRDPARAEISFTVADAWQRQGLATLLFSILWHEGWQLGVRAFHGVCRSGNLAMISWWRGIGGRAVVAARHGELDFPLENPAHFVTRVSFEMPPRRRRIELAQCLAHWTRLTEAGEP